MGLPDDRGGASYGTYVMPCRSFGILDTGDAVRPVQILPRGQALHRSRCDVLRGSTLVDAIIQGGTITAAALKSEAQFFSVNALDQLENERELLQDAFVREYVSSSEVSTRYRRFLATTTWAFKRLDRDAMSSAQLIAAAYREAADGRSGDEVGMAWAEYELRRRVHFALELLLGALTDTLMDLTEGTVADVLDAWSSDEPMFRQFLSEVLAIEQPVWRVTLEDMYEGLPTEAWLKHPLPVSEARNLPAWCKALFGVAVLGASRRQTQVARAASQIPHRESYLEHAFAVLDTELGEYVGDGGAKAAHRSGDRGASVDDATKDEPRAAVLTAFLSRGCPPQTHWCPGDCRTQRGSAWKRARHVGRSRGPRPARQCIHFD